MAHEESRPVQRYVERVSIKAYERKIAQIDERLDKIALYGASFSAVVVLHIAALIAMASMGAPTWWLVVAIVSMIAFALLSCDMLRAFNRLLEQRADWEAGRVELGIRTPLSELMRSYDEYLPRDEN